MKKSEIYKKAQYAVVNSLCIDVVDKMEILRELIEKEDLALWSEKKEEEARVAQAV